MICIFALTTSSYRNPQGTIFAGAACDLLLPMLSSPRFSALTFPLSALFEPLHPLIPIGNVERCYHGV